MAPAYEPAPSVPAPPSVRVPALITVSPVYVFAPDNVTVLASPVPPLIVSEPPPLTTPLKVIEPTALPIELALASATVPA